MANEHILKSFDEELNRLNHMIAEMGGLAEAALADAVQALSRRDADFAARIVAQDSRVDELEAQIQDFAVRVLALRQPMANDLRQVVSALRIAGDIERMADYAANVAKRTIALSNAPAIDAVRAIPRMSRMVEAMIKDVLDAFVERDVEKADEVWRRDGEVDDVYTALFRELLTYMMEDPRNISPCTHVLFIAKNIERIGDHATNIAESVHYLVLGERMTQSRPKSDTSSFQVVTPNEQGTAGGDAGNES